MTKGSSDGREGYTGVSAGSFSDGMAGIYGALLIGSFENMEGHSVLYAARKV